jgi:hypothetical protein
VTLGDAFRVFAGRPTARVLGVVVAVVLPYRLALGAWGWLDLAVAGAILAFEPFTEWVIHTQLLHFRPKQFGRFRIDPLEARKHREHHADPKDVDLVFIPMPSLVFALAVGIVAPVLIADTRAVAMTATLTSFAMLLAYEWTHYLIHSPYRPKSSLYKKVWRAHRWHHFRNENYWFGVTMHLADRVLRTYPDRDAVPLSPTAKDLAAALDAERQPR